MKNLEFSMKELRLSVPCTLFFASFYTPYPSIPPPVSLAHRRAQSPRRALVSTNSPSSFSTLYCSYRIIFSRPDHPTPPPPPAGRHSTFRQPPRASADSYEQIRILEQPHPPSLVSDDSIPRRPVNFNRDRLQDGLIEITARFSWRTRAAL